MLDISSGNIVKEEYFKGKRKVMISREDGIYLSDLDDNTIQLIGIENEEIPK